MNKKDLSERDICSKFISPAVKRAGWDGMIEHSQSRTANPVGRF
jgi:type I site-specific restriction endonuclease